MSSGATPKEQQRVAGQSIFADLNPKRTSSSDGQKKSVSDPIFSPEKVKVILEKSYRDGYERCMKEGYANGMDLARQSVTNDKKSLFEMTAHFSGALGLKAEQISEEVLSLSLDIAKAMLRAQLKVKPEAILSLIQEVLSKTPIAAKPLQLFLHPHDATIIRTHMQEDLARSGWVVFDDTKIERGGCRVETSANTIDASNKNRWQYICQALGTKNDWLESTS